ncbi:MAG: DEAD/DEAH box helicase [Nocardioidaceae bacterium]
MPWPVRLRPYQVEAIEAIEKAEARGVRRPLVVLPTAAGKTVIFSALIGARPGRSLVLVHREELVTQTVEKINLIAPDLHVGVVKADRDEYDAQVVVASVQTAYRDNRLSRLSGFGTVVCDEAHHASAPSWRKILDHLHCLCDPTDNSGCAEQPLTVGFTATPERDGSRLGVWDEPVYYKPIREMIYHDYLAPITGQVVSTSANLSGIRLSHGDLVESDMGAEMERSGALDEIADAYRDYAGDRKGIAYTPTVSTAHELARQLCVRGIPAEAVDAATPRVVRRETLARLKTGETQVVTNCAVLTEGFDEPSVSCIVVARPTRFHGLYIQMVGRGTRKHPGKENLLVLDVTGASQRHDLVAVVDLGIDRKRKKKQGLSPGGGYECVVCDEACGIAEHFCVLCDRPLPASSIGAGDTRHLNCHAQETTRVDVFATSKLRWLDVEDGYCLGAGKETVVMVPSGRDDGGTWTLAATEAGRVEVLHPALPFEWAQGIGEDRVKAFGKLARRDARWLGEEPTQRQLSRLVHEGLPEAKLPAVKTRGQAADLITRIQARRATRKLHRVSMEAR